LQLQNLIEGPAFLSSKSYLSDDSLAGKIIKTLPPTQPPPGVRGVLIISPLGEIRKGVYFLKVIST
jgi:hypothetical protein